VPGRKTPEFRGNIKHTKKDAECFGSRGYSLARMTNLRELTLHKFKTCNISALTNITYLQILVVFCDDELWLPPNLTTLVMKVEPSFGRRALRIICPAPLQKFDLACTNIDPFDVVLNAGLHTWKLGSSAKFIQFPPEHGLRNFVLKSHIHAPTASFMAILAIFGVAVYLEPRFEATLPA
jgi:hypothetical protein